MKLFIELCKARDSWLALSEDERRAFLKPVGALMDHLRANGVEIIAWGENDDLTPARAPYDYFAVFVFPDGTSADSYESLFRAAGWYEYFEQVNVCGDVQSHDSVMQLLIGE